uniref:Uncharacterized protein n=1 Tax=Pyropia pulchra TaxID=60925 RepID=A0A141SFB2_9RHOD|nr:hypothetical protein Ppul_148 [Pyropia pulchra]AMK96980.1 hypothetical protein Ppul_148 [Pyropia pulchra]
MNLAQTIAEYSSAQNSNNFYCTFEHLSPHDLNSPKSSKPNLSFSTKVITFVIPRFDFIPSNIKNSIREGVIISNIEDNNIFANSTNNWVKKHKDKNHHSLFYKKIFKALLNQKIRVVAEPIKTPEIGKEHDILVSQKYVWGKSWQPSIISSYLKNKNNNVVSNASKKFLIDQLSASPVFVIKNGFNEIILGHPLSRIKRGGINNITYSFQNLLSQHKQAYPISTGLFFFHPDDAFEFKNFIKSVNPLAAQQMEINVEPVGLHFAYKMNRSISSDTKFTFIPDFKEVGDLLFKYRRDKHLIFHKDQRYGKNFFQGQPVYIIQPISLKDRSGKINIIKFTGLNDNREVLFTNLEAANKSWTNFIKNNSQLKSIKKPTLLVYNLESFLKDQEKLNKQDFQKFVVVTNKKAYVATKELIALPDSNNFFKHLKLNMKPKLFFMELWVRRLFSTLTYE